jgi:Ca2+-binding EF-hand superfamily protein
MSRGKTIALIAAVLLAAGSVAAISAGGPGGWRHHGGEGWGGGHMGGHMGMGPMGMGGPMMGRGGPEDDMMGRRGMFGRGELTSAESEARARERFARYDRNGDGIIDRSEIEAAFADFATRGPWGERAGKRVDRLTHMLGGKDGRVTKDQALDTVRRAFDEMDLDGDGRITDADLPPMMRGRGGLGAGIAGMRRMPMGQFGQLLREAAAADGTVSRDAVMAVAAQRFDQFDRNRDGALDKADFDALRKETSDYRVQRFLHHFGATAAGQVTRDQFLAKAKERFARLDSDGNGTISRDEMPFGRMHGPGMGERMRRWWGGEGGRGEGHPAPGGPGQPPRN